MGTRKIDMKEMTENKERSKETKESKESKDRKKAVVVAVVSARMGGRAYVCVLAINLLIALQRAVIARFVTWTCRDGLCRTVPLQRLRKAGFRACICRLLEATRADSRDQHVQTPEAAIRAAILRLEAQDRAPGPLTRHRRQRAHHAQRMAEAMPLFRRPHRLWGPGTHRTLQVTATSHLLSSLTVAPGIALDSRGCYAFSTAAVILSYFVYTNV